ncbi:hydroxypyruvate isomerase family protein [Pseudohongiella spirulinae]|uniref:Hydroxypyruvate isomerase n=1 Tax=Pseudohongiella spirulinae TaxID=1249552 RepID=A0A0S2KFZ5_9GAMM|nr:TIM barrel protein [Pseudohongiella spirulinae]ALO46882.1 hydroxypyruvate isomerase [Pseudohongiella spirulinae]
MPLSISRRELVKRAIAAGLALAAAGGGAGVLAQTGQSSPNAGRNFQARGNIRHSVAQWTYAFLTLEELCEVVNGIGFAAIDLIGPEQWQILKDHNIDCSMCNGAEISLVEGWNRPDLHSTLIGSYRSHIELMAQAGYSNLICFSGNRDGMDDETGLQNCANGLKQIMSLAERHNITVQMELFNSKIDHPDYMCDSSAWGIELCERIGSPNFRLLYDIYHMQVQEGDIIHTIRNHHQWFGHYHTAGVPGRNEIDDSQELNYPAIMRAIVETGFSGYVAQEFIPRRQTPDGARSDEERIASLAQAVSICDV